MFGVRDRYFQLFLDSLDQSFPFHLGFVGGEQTGCGGKIC
jgi:hypothetical protein